MKIKSINLLIIALTIHIFSVHCKLLYYLNPEVQAKHAFSFIYLDEPTILAMIFAPSYSLATSFVVFSTNRRTLVLLYALLDTIGVLLYYFTKIPIYFGAIYFAIYSGILISPTVYLKSPKYLSDRIVEMKEKWVTQRYIASELKISKSKISRMLKRIKNHSEDKIITN